MEKKKNIYNLIMAAAILVILLAGVMIAGNLRGWFGGGQTVVAREDGTQKIVEILVESKKGNVSLTRDGVSFTLEKDASLRDGDIIETRMGSAVTLLSGENTLYLDEKSRAQVHVTEEGIVRITLESGGAFGSISEAFALELMETEITTEGSVFSASAPYGSAGMHIFEKSVAVGEETAEAGQAVSILKSGEDGEIEIQITKLSIQSLNSFELACAALVQDSHTLCFTAKEMEELIEQRQQTVADARKTASDLEVQENANNGGEAGNENADGSAKDGSAEKDGGGSGNTNIAEGTPSGTTGENNGSTQDPGSGSGGNAGTSGSGAGGSAGTSGSGAGSNAGTSGSGSGGNTGTSGNGAGGNTGTSGSGSGGNGDSQGSGSAGTGDSSGSGQTSEPEPSGGSCTIKIVCDTILNNMDSLAPGKDGYVPANGVILSTSTMSFSDGETVFDVLKRACSSAGIQLEYSWTPMYNSYYVEGINNLYEFDCGSQSGWMYKVNGWFPNYGCSSYTLSDGDTIVWCYTCVGLGEDVGGSVY